MSKCELKHVFSPSGNLFTRNDCHEVELLQKKSYVNSFQKIFYRFG